MARQSVTIDPIEEAAPRRRRPAPEPELDQSQPGLPGSDPRAIGAGETQSFPAVPPQQQPDFGPGIQLPKRPDQQG